jgi:hypothetical protein
MPKDKQLRVLYDYAASLDAVRIALVTTIQAHRDEIDPSRLDSAQIVEDLLESLVSEIEDDICRKNQGNTSV